MSEATQAIIEDLDLGIELPDGTRLSARLWRCALSDAAPVPAILEYLPYRKSDGTAARDDTMHPHFAAQGYACLRVDARGCGDSEGLFDDEYSEQELQDGVDIIAWIANQAWCSGAVGMQGISWGGFNALQIAARQPAALKAIITIGSTVDRYADDIHYKGGVQLSENIGWAATAMSWFSMPPDPAIVGDRWREMWLQRLQQTPFLAATWLRHPHRDPYWQHGSVCEDYSAIKAAVLSLGGLHDGYRNTMAQLAQNLSAPVKAIAGPWNHKYPHISNIAPAIDYLGEALRWWDHWLKDEPTGVADDPAYRAYLMHSTAPAPNLERRAGHWVAEPRWPSDTTQTLRLGLGEGSLGEASPFTLSIEPELAVGRCCGEYFPFGFGPGELPDDQRADDALSLCFDGTPLTQALDLLGAPAITLALSSDQPRAQLIARLCDLRPDGSSHLISLGLLDLRQRDSAAEPRELPVGEPLNIELRLDQCAYRLPPGHRLRLALSSSYWPYCWPEPTPARLQISGGELRLPQRPFSDSPEWHFAPPAAAPTRPNRALTPAREEKHHRSDGQKLELHILGDDGRQEDTISGIITSSSVTEHWQIERDDPCSARSTIRWCRSFGRGQWQVNTQVDTELWGDQQHWHVKHTLQAWEDTQKLFEKRFEDRIPRN